MAVVLPRSADFPTRFHEARSPPEKAPVEQIGAPLRGVRRKALSAARSRFPLSFCSFECDLPSNRTPDTPAFGRIASGTSKCPGAPSGRGTWSSSRDGMHLASSYLNPPYSENFEKMNEEPLKAALIGLTLTYKKAEQILEVVADSAFNGTYENKIMNEVARTFAVNYRNRYKSKIIIEE